MSSVAFGLFNQCWFRVGLGGSGAAEKLSQTSQNPTKMLLTKPKTVIQFILHLVLLAYQQFTHDSTLCLLNIHQPTSSSR